jgi:hypothetical protein
LICFKGWKIEECGGVETTSFYDFCFSFLIFLFLYFVEECGGVETTSFYDFDFF